jgi:YD repeat-containing protein
MKNPSLRGTLWSACISGATLLVLALPAAATSLQLTFTVPSSFNESNRQAVLEWNAEPARTYLVQSATNLSPETVWKTEEPVRAATNGPIKWMSPEALSSQKYYRLILPQPEVFAVEPAFVNSADPAALFYLIGQCFPTNGSVVINGLNFTPTLVDSNGGWMAISLNGLPPGTPILGNILVLDNASNIVSTLPLQNPVLYGTELTAEQLQGPPDEPPASPEALLGTWLSKRGYDYYKARSDMNAAGLQNNPYFVENNGAGEMPEARSAYHRGHVTVLKSHADGPPDAAERSSFHRGHVTVLKSHADGPSDSSVSRHRGHVTVLKSHADDDGDGVDVFPATGELRCDETDLAIPGRGLDFAWTRTYRSRAEGTTAQGAGWDFSFNVSVTSQPDGTVVLRPGNGRADTFYPNGTNGWTRDEYFLVIRDVDQDGSPDEVVFSDGGKWTLHPPGPAFAGKLAEIVDRNNNTIRCEYDTDTGRLLQVVDTLDRTNTVAYTSKGLIESVTDFSGRTVRYEYDSAADLIACVSPAVIGTPNGNDFPGGKTNRYAYSGGNVDQRLNHNLVAITDPKGQVCLEVTYHATNNPASLDFDAVSSLLRGIDKKDIRRGMVIARPSNSFATVQTILNDYVGNVTEYLFDSRQRCVSVREFTGRANPALPTTVTENRPTGKLRPEDPDYFETRWEWNADSLCTRELRPDGGSTEISHQRVQDHNSSRSNKSSTRAHDGDVRVVRERASSAVDTDGDGTPDTSELAWYYEYDPRFGSPATACGKKLYVGNLPFSARGPRQSTSLDGSYDHTPIIKGSALGRNIESAKVVTDRDTGRSKGFGFCTSATDPRGIVSTSSYDTNGNLVHVETTERKSGYVTAADFDYKPHGRLGAITNAPDANGFRRVDTFSYYASGAQAGYLESITIDESGVHLTSTFEYDARGNLTRCVDPRTNDWLFTYNALDQCVRSESPTNITSRCVTDSHYDENGNVVRTTTELRDGTDVLVQKVDTFCGYDSRDRCISLAEQVYKGYFVTNRFEYDPNDNLVAILSPRAASGVDPNARTTYAYDERGLLFRAVSAPGTGLGATNEWDYDGNGNVRVSKVDSFTFKFAAFDGFGRPASDTDAMSNVVTYAYDRNDNLVFARVNAETNDTPSSAGNLRYHEWRWSYDGLDRCIEARSMFFDPATQLPIGDGDSVTTYRYALNGDCVSLTDDNGHTTRYSYDTAGRCSQITDPKTNLTQFTYDRCDNLTSVVSIERPDSPGSAQQFSRSYVYDALGRCVQSVDNVGNSNLCSYDSLDRVVRCTDPKGVVSWSVYDDLSRLIRSVGDLDGDGVPELAMDVDASWAYDENSRCTSSTDDNTNTTFYSYDSLDRCVGVTQADGTSCSLIWSPRSNLLLRQDANGTVVSNSFDLLDRCVRTDITPGPGVAATTTFELFAYDGLSRCVAASNDVSLVTFAYDSLGNCVRSTQDGLASVGTFDGVGNCLSQTYPGGRVVTRTYNPLDEVASLSSSAGGGLPPVTLATYAYEGPGRPGKISRANGIDTRLAWNGKANPANPAGDFGWRQVSGVSHQAVVGVPVIDRRISAYDRNQNKIVRAQTAPFFVGGPTTTNLFTFDARDRLTQFTRASGSPADLFRAYSLDGNGNRLVGISNGVVTPYIMDRTFPVPADFQMNQYTLTPFVLAPEQYDQNGNLIGRISATAQLAFQYDYADRLVQVTDFGGGIPTPVASFSYNALGQRNIIARYPPGLPPVTTQFVHDHLDDDSDGDIIEERVNGTLRRTYAVPHVFEQKGRVMFTDTGEMFYYHCDELGSTLALTDAGGNVIERYDYDDFGQPFILSPDGVPTGETESGVGNPYLFHGLEWDVAAGFYHDGAGGYVDPQVGRALKPKIAKESHGRSRGAENNPWSQRSINNINGGMPNRISMNRISMNVTVPKQTQGATFGEKMKSGTVKFFNEAKGFGLISGGDNGGGNEVIFNPKEYTITKSYSRPPRSREDVYVWKLKKEEGGRHTPFHNKYRPSFNTISNVQKSKHDAAMAAIQNTR